MPRRLQLAGAKRPKRTNVLLDATIRDFSGGWNVVDNDLNLSTRFQKILSNLQLGSDGAISVRPGTRLFADVSAYMSRIINCEYFQGHIICVGSNGQIVKVDGSGNVAIVWSNDWASHLPGSPDGWTVTTFASFATFRGELIICNGINKPVIINSSLMATYLNDLANGSNANTPIARYVVAHDRFLVMAGINGRESVITVSATDTSGTWLNDGAPNDAVEVDLGSRVPSGDAIIKGLGRFRDKLMVAFEDVLLPGTLGIFDDSGDHIPVFDDAIESHGSISHRVIQNIGEDMLFADAVGVPSVSRALFTGSIRPERFSALIDPEIRSSINALTLTSTLEDRTFSIYDQQDSVYLLFIPNNDRIADTTETRVYAFKRNKQLKVEAWSLCRDWNWTSSCKSALNRVFYTNNTQVYIRGNKDDPITADFVGDQEMFSDDTTWTDQTGFTPVAAIIGSGIPIRFIWELPWTDADQRFLTKTSRFINLDSEGSDSKFTVSMFVDNIYDDRNDLGEDWIEDELKFDDLLGWKREPGQLNPTLSMEFTAGKSAGFGFDEFGEDFGGGRPTQREDLYAWTAQYKINKLRIDGETVNPLKFISITLAYQQGSIRR